MCPVEVGRTTSYFWTPRTLTLSGLSAGKRYNFEAYVSRPGGQLNTYSIGTANLGHKPQ